MSASGPCACGESVERQVPPDLSPRYRELLERTPLVCERCSASAEAEQAREEQERKAQAKADLLERRVRSAGLPLALQGLPWGDLRSSGREEAVGAARSWAAGDLTGLFLTGPVGVGKTHIAATAAWTLLERAPLRWLSVPLLLARLSADFKSEAREWALAAMTATNTALVLDDLDKARPKEYAAEQLLAAVDGRVQAAQPLLVTSNLTLSELAEKWPAPHGESIASRLAGCCEKFRIDGVDRRLRGTG